MALGCTAVRAPAAPASNTAALAQHRPSLAAAASRAPPAAAASPATSAGPARARVQHAGFTLHTAPLRCHRPVRCAAAATAEPVAESSTAEVHISPASERAAATSALGSHVAARMQADCIRAVRAWCKLGYGDHIGVHVEHQQLALASAPGLLTSAAVTFGGPDGRRHAVVAVTVGVRCGAATPSRSGVSSLPTPSPSGAMSPSRLAVQQQQPATAPGSAAPSLDPLPGLSLHWGCCQGAGQRWQGPGTGWHTLPGVSYDAGKGAWQTPMAVRQALPLDAAASELAAGGRAEEGAAAGGEWAAAYTLLLQVPYEGAAKDGGLCFVLKTARDQWIKAAPASGSGKKGEVDFYIGTAGLPLVAEGAALQPDVFRPNMTHSDSLPQVFQNQPGAEQGGHEGKGASKGEGGKHHSGKAEKVTLSATDTDLLGAAASFMAPPRPSDAIMRPAERHPLPGGPLAPCGWMLDHIAQREPEAERSLMHRYNAGADLVEMAGGSSEVEAALAMVTAWLRLSSQRLLVWNRNYNIKPREISTAQGRLAAAVAALGASRGPAAPGGRGSAAVGVLARVALAAVGRGGAGEVGQRIRDEILSVQQRNGCKGGMMEEWHQKLHNNTSPDDVVICQALLDYIAAGLDIQAYWRTLARANITAQRLASFDRAITSEPRFSGQQAAGLQRDLSAYLQTLQAVHGGDDLRSAISNVLGYEETDMKGKRISVPPLSAVASAPGLARHLRALLALQQHLSRPQTPSQAQAAAELQRSASPGPAPKPRPSAAAGGGAEGGVVLPPSAPHRPTSVAALWGLPGASRLMEMVVEARHLLRPFLDGGNDACGGRLVDVVFLDLALDSALRTIVESNISAIKQAVTEGTAVHIAAAAAGGGQATGAFAASAAMGQALEIVRLAAENAALSTTPNDDLAYSNKWLRLLVAQEDPRDSRDRMMQALAICDRIKRSLTEQAAATLHLVQPAVGPLAERLGIKKEAVSGVGEEVVRGTSGAPLAQMLAFLEPALRRATGGGPWQIVSRGAERAVLAGRLRVEPRLEAVQHERMQEATVLVVEMLTGAEEIPEGCVAVLVGSASEGGGSGCPDMLSHSAVRARNMGVLLAGCYSPEVVSKLVAKAGSRVMVRLEGADVSVDFGSS